jgi:hypothetical protein
MEYLERTAIAGNTVNINKERSIQMDTPQKEQVVINVQIPINEVVQQISNNLDAIFTKPEFTETLDFAIASYVTANSEEIAANVDFDEKIKDEVQSLIEDFESNFDVTNYISISDIASEVSSEIDLESSLEYHLSLYSPTSKCNSSKSAYNAIIKSINYDLMCHGTDKRETHYVHEISIYEQLERVVREIIQKYNEEQNANLVNDIRKYEFKRERRFTVEEFSKIIENSGVLDRDKAKEIKNYLDGYSSI